MGLHRARPTMNGLLVLSTLAAASAQVVLPYGGPAYGGLAGYHGLGYHGLGYPYAVAKPVVNEVEVPVPVIEYAVHETGCKNSFGHAVPCLQEGEARRKRSADEEAAAVAAPAPVEVEVPVTQYKYVPEVKTVEFPPPARTLSALPFPALKSVATLCL